MLGTITRKLQHRLVGAVFLLSVACTSAAAQTLPGERSNSGRETAVSPLFPWGPGDATLVRTAAARRPAMAAAQLALGRRLLERGQYRPAIRALSHAYSIQTERETLVLLARACRKNDLDTEAAAIYLRLEKMAPTAEQQSFLDAELMTLKAKLDDLADVTTESGRTHMELAKQKFRVGLFTEAADELSFAYALLGLPRILFNLAQAYRRAEKVDDAYILYVRFLEEEPPGSPLHKESVGYMMELRSLSFKPPVYKRPWFWGVLGTAAAVVAAGSAGLAIALRPKDPATDGGEIMFNF